MRVDPVNAASHCGPSWAGHLPPHSTRVQLYDYGLVRQRRRFPESHFVTNCQTVTRVSGDFRVSTWTFAISEIHHFQPFPAILGCCEKLADLSLAFSRPFYVLYLTGSPLYDTQARFARGNAYPRAHMLASQTVNAEHKIISRS